MSTAYGEPPAAHRRPGAAAAPRRARAGGALERGEVDRTGAAERLLRHGSNPRDPRGARRQRLGTHRSPVSQRRWPATLATGGRAPCCRSPCWESAPSSTTRPVRSARARLARSRSSRCWPGTPACPQPRVRIAATFWPSSPEQQALTNLRRELHQLRRTLADDDSLVVTSTDLAWRDRDTCRVDLREFERARERVLAAERRRHRGRPRARRRRAGGVPRRAAARPVRRLDPRPARRAGRRVRRGVRAGDRRRPADRAVGGRAPGRAAARRAAPLDEVGYRDLIRVQAGMGDRAGAVSTYHHCASVLQQELGVDPDPTTRRLLADLVDQPSATRPAVPAEPGRGLGGLRGPARGAARARPRPWPRPSRARCTRSSSPASRAWARAGWSPRPRGWPRRHDAVVAPAHCYGVPGRLALAPVAEWLSEPTLAAGPGLAAPGLAGRGRPARAQRGPRRRVPTSPAA